MRIEIKPDRQIKAKRRYSLIGAMGVLFAIQLGRELCDYASHDTWENILILIGGLTCATIGCIALWKYSKLRKDKNRKTN